MAERWLANVSWGGGGEEESESFVSITPVLTNIPNRVINEVPQTGP